MTLKLPNSLTKDSTMVKFWACLLMMSLCGCQQPDGARPIEYELAAAPVARWTVDPRPLTTIGGDGASELLNVVGIARLADGSVAVACNGTTDIRLFRADGTPVRQIGRDGRGPGEFDGLFELRRMNDTLIGIGGDGVGQAFSAQGTYLRSIPRQPTPTGVRPTHVGYLNDGRQLFRSAPARSWQEPGSTEMPQATLWLSDASSMRSIAKFPSFEAATRADGRRTRLVFGPQGNVVSLRDGFCTTFSKVYLLNCYRTIGSQIFSMERKTFASRPVTQSDREMYFEVNDRANPGPLGAPQREAVRKNAVFATHLPALGRMLASPEDEVWIGPMDPAEETVGVSPSPAGPTVWSVFSPTGVWLSDVTLPRRFRLMEVGVDYVAGSVRDDDGVERVVVYKYRKT